MRQLTSSRLVALCAPIGKLKDGTQMRTLQVKIHQLIAKMKLRCMNKSDVIKWLARQVPTEWVVQLVLLILMIEITLTTQLATAEIDP